MIWYFLPIVIMIVPILLVWIVGKLFGADMSMSRGKHHDPVVQELREQFADNLMISRLDRMSDKLSEQQKHHSLDDMGFL